MNPSFCNYCQSKNIVKKGKRERKREIIQLWYCNDCRKVFTPDSIKGRHFPLTAVLDGISFYNLGFSLEKSCEILKERTKLAIQPSTLFNWVEENKDLCRYHRYRPFAIKMFKPQEVVITATLAHRQLYRYRFHRAKTSLIIREDIKHARFGPLAEFLALVPSDTPHQLFQESMRASEAPLAFSKEAMIVRSKTNFANKLAAFVLQSVKNNKDRHEAVQKFMLANDTVTVATEVPVYLKREDLAHMQTQLGFEVYKKSRKRELEKMAEAELPKLITGHIDVLQVRNGQIHILDYKPKAAKEKPIEQLTIYAMALSRLTGLRMFEFKCAWFDEKDYFEFYPLHVVHKRKGKRLRKNISTKEGVYRLNESRDRFASLKPYAV